MPSILLTGKHDADIDVAAMKAGASDYLIKGELSGDILERTIRYALQRRELDQRLEHLAFYDSLTDLPNRVLFLDRVTQALARQARAASVVTVIFLDIDNFKDVNDTYGHSAGDILLRKVSARVRSQLRLEDTMARLGGDEFAICMETPIRTGNQIAIDFVQRALGTLMEAFDLEIGASVEVRASFGISNSTAEAATATELLRNADIAMYEAKANGKNTYAIYRSSMHDVLQRRTSLEKDLRKALRTKSLDVAFQPFFVLSRGSNDPDTSSNITGFEALTRWTHDELGPQDPVEFIGIAEESGLIVDLGREVLLKSCRQAVEWTASHGFDGFMSVNVSPRQVSHASFVDTLNECLSETNIDPERLVIEITESVMFGDPDYTIEILHKVRELGVRIALDDFGTGYSSLSHLHLLPVQLIKVDRSFVARAEEEAGRAMLGAIAAMASNLELTIIAEGIETPEQQEILHEMGYDYGQGFFRGGAERADTAAASFLAKQIRE